MKSKNFPFCLCSQQLISTCKRSFVHDLHSKVCSGSSEYNKIHTTNVSLAKALQKIAQNNRTFRVHHIIGLPSYITVSVRPKRCSGAL
ncbi:hypothetical protein Ddye_027977 [Dipteronia dyeriana]|uniref:Uncharacterized protein n=1 Tax=Dipteronia dyeriana TaxID=168575 RepID=A0AAD9TR12_9ROSI|nr:hypothetical protein Ddye_027975 [Dipteronia dyeriana]KAK2640182.1 hypothetical protein Ddye_027977 [Dipteronia dyeriana]